MAITALIASLFAVSCKKDTTKTKDKPENKVIEEEDPDPEEPLSGSIEDIIPGGWL